MKKQYLTLNSVQNLDEGNCENKQQETVYTVADDLKYIGKWIESLPKKLEDPLKEVQLYLSRIYQKNRKEALVELREKLASGASLKKMNLSNLNLRCFAFEEKNLSFANLRNANLTSANLKNANLEGAYLKNTTLLAADLVGARLYRANLQGTNLCGTLLDGVDLDGAVFNETKVCPQNRDLLTSLGICENRLIRIA